MCGICGYIGKSLNPEISFKLTEKLFEESSIRGVEASGFWGIGDKIIYHKEPFQSFFLVTKPIWQEVFNINPSLLILHTRQPSGRTGSSYINSNNHPFVSSNFELAVIHNGKIDEYNLLRKKFEVKSDCDSEVILRIIESQDSVLNGLKMLISLTPLPETALALAIADTSKTLWLYRNEHRPIWIARVKGLGQLFFCSTPEIWLNTMSRFPDIEYDLFEMPAHQIWQISEDLSYKKFKIIRKDKINWDSIETYKIKESKSQIEVLKELDDKDNVNVFYPIKNDNCISDLCNEIKQSLNVIENIPNILNQYRIESELIEIKFRVNRLFNEF